MGPQKKKKKEKTNPETGAEFQWIVASKATLSTYDTPFQLSRLQKIYRIQDSKIRCCAELLEASARRMQSDDLFFSENHGFNG